MRSSRSLSRFTAPTSPDCSRKTGVSRKDQKTTERKMLKRRDVLVALAAVTFAGTASAQDAVDVAKAKAEGKVVWYTSTPIEQGQKIVGLFEKAHGIKVEMFR